MKSAAKIRSLPAMPSASAMQESLPLWMIAPCSRSSTDTLLLRMANMVEPPAGAPPLRQAFSLIRYSSVSLILPSLMALKTTSTVISFIMLDGARNSSAFFSNNTLPLDASTRIAVGASPSKPPSSFFGAPCTLLLAAYTIPPHPTASATTAAIRTRHGMMAAARDLPETEVSAAIGDVLNPSVLTVGSIANNTGFGFAAVSIGLRRRTKERIVAVLGEQQAVIVGHDWGAPVAWHAAMFRPDIFTRVAGLSVPPPSRGRGLPLETLRKNGITNFYWQYFQAPGVAEAEFERDVAATMRIVLAGRGFSDPAAHQYVQEGKGFLAGAEPNRPLPNWLTEADIATFAEVYRQSGFRGGLNWYRNIDRNWELTAPWQGAQIQQPSLFIAGSKDGVITGLIGAKLVNEMERVLPNLRQKLILDGAGHWIQQERPDEVNAALIAFLKS